MIQIMVLCLILLWVLLPIRLIIPVYGFISLLKLIMVRIIKLYSLILMEILK